MSVWKEFCRHIEGKQSRRHFGDLASVVDRCALFEFTDEQVDQAKAHVPADLSVERPHPIPPFPFPQMCLVGSAGVIVLQKPSMDEATGILKFEMMMCAFGGGGVFFQKAMCVVDSTRLEPNGNFPMELRDLEGIWDGRFWGDEHNSLMAENFEEGMDFISRRKKEQKELAALRAAGKSEAADELERKLAELRVQRADIQRKIVKKNGELKDLGKEAADLQAEQMRDAFYLGLQEVNWINHPNHFTVRSCAASPKRKPKKRQKGTRVRRLRERERYIVLTKQEITEEWRRIHQGGTHAPPIPHLRRGHYKILRAARFKEKKGQRVWVRATHVNGHCVEWRDGDVRYKVL